MRGFSLLRCVGLAVLLAAYSCNEHTLDPVFYGSLEGTVTYEATGLPVYAAEITTLPATSLLITDSLGHFLLRDIPTGEYTVMATLEGYKHEINKVVVYKNNTTSTDIRILPATDPPYPALTPTPAHDAINVARDIILRWVPQRNADEALTYHVMLYESTANEPFLDLPNHNDTLVSVTGLKFDTHYYWQVNTRNAFGAPTNGALWHFKTLPFPDNRFLFTSSRDGNPEVYSSDDTGNQRLRLTFTSGDEAYPRYSHGRDRIAYSAFRNQEHHVYIMNQNGAGETRVTTLPVDGFRNGGKGFCWSPDNGRIAYSHYDKLYVIDADGSGLSLVSTAPGGRHYRGCDWTSEGNMIVVETVGVLPYDSEIHLIDLNTSDDVVIVANEPGTVQSPSFSVDGKSVLYTYDVSAFESPTGRQLDSRIFILALASGVATEIAKDKVPGTNDLNPRFSPDGAKIIFENRSNDGSGSPSVWMYEIASLKRTKLFDNAAMPDWR